MNGEQIFIFNNVPYKCTFFSGYDGHYYCTVYDDRDGTYLGQVADIKEHDSNCKARLKAYVDAL